MTRPIRSDERAIAPGVLLLLGALGVVALLQAPSVGAWWAEDRALLTQLLGTSPDPLGFSVIPKVMLFSLPTLAAMALTLFVLTSILGMLTRADLGLHALGACAALQMGLVIGLHLVLHAVRSVGGAIQGLFTTSPDAEASAQALEWFARHDAASVDVSWRLVWILGGYLVAVAAAGLATSRR